jgi:hypothetical protein
VDANSAPTSVFCNHAFVKLGTGDIILQGKHTVGSAKLIVPAIFHGSTSCGTRGIIYSQKFVTQSVRVVLAGRNPPVLRLHNKRRARGSTTLALLYRYYYY